MPLSIRASLSRDYPAAEDDEVVPIGNGEKLCRGLRSLGASVSWRAYEDGGHWVNEPQGVDDMVAFLSEKCC